MNDPTHCSDLGLFSSSSTSASSPSVVFPFLSLTSFSGPSHSAISGGEPFLVSSFLTHLGLAEEHQL